MASPVKPSEICETVPSPTASICDKFKKFFNLPKLLCEFWEWAFDSDGNATTGFKGLFVGVGIPVGGIIFFPIDSVPEGYLICNGQTVSRTVYASLFAVYSTQFGAGDGTTTFNVPNLQDKFLIGASGAKAVKSSGGLEQVSLTGDQNGPHTHDVALKIQNSESGSDDTTYVQSSGAAASLTTTSSGTGSPHENMPPYTAGLWLCKT